MSTPNIKTNTTELQNILEEINNLPDAGGVELPTLSTPGTANDLLKDKELIDQDGNIVVGTIESRDSSDLSRQGPTITAPAGHYEEDATLTIPNAGAILYVSVDSAGLVKAEHIVDISGMATDKVTTKQLDTQPATSITPTKSTQTAVTSGKYTTGNIIVNPIPDEYITTDDATATEETVGLGETFYADGEKKTGSFTLDTEISDINSLATQIKSALDGKAGGNGDNTGGSTDSMNTCTVHITSTGGNFGNTSGTVCYTTVENNQILVKRIDGTTNELSIKCLCNSLLIVNETGRRVYHNFSGLDILNGDNNAFFVDLGFYCFIVSASAGETANLSIALG